MAPVLGLKASVGVQSLATLILYPAMLVARRDLVYQNLHCGFSNCGGLGGPCIYAGRVGGIIGLLVICDGSSVKHRCKAGEAFAIAELPLCF